MVIVHWQSFLCVGSVLSPFSSSADGRACALSIALDHTCTQLRVFRVMSFRQHFTLSLTRWQFDGIRLFFYTSHYTGTQFSCYSMAFDYTCTHLQLDGISMAFENNSTHSTTMYTVSTSLSWWRLPRMVSVASFILCNSFRHTAISMVRAFSIAADS